MSKILAPIEDQISILTSHIGFNPLLPPCHRASKSCRRADARLCKNVGHLRKIGIFERKTGTTSTFYEFWQNLTKLLKISQVFMAF